MNRAFTANGPRSFLPPADVVVTNDEVTVYMDVPGLKADGLEIELENDVLTVRGERVLPNPARTGGPGSGSSAASVGLSARSGFPADWIRTRSERS
jgi:Hsp20/alpha crystallin family protein